MAKLKITLIHRANTTKHRKVVQALGLHKIGQSVEPEATPAILGMVRHVAHLVCCEETEGGATE